MSCPMWTTDTRCHRPGIQRMTAKSKDLKPGIALSWGSVCLTHAKPWVWAPALHQQGLQGGGWGTESSGWAVCVCFSFYNAYLPCIWPRVVPSTTQTRYGATPHCNPSTRRRRQEDQELVSFNNITSLRPTCATWQLVSKNNSRLSLGYIAILRVSLGYVQKIK